MQGTIFDCSLVLLTGLHWHLFAVDFDVFLVTRPLVFDIRPILRLAWVELSCEEAVIIWSNVENRVGFLATHDISAPDEIVIVRAINTGSAEDVFSGSLEAKVDAI